MKNENEIITEEIAKKRILNVLGNLEMKHFSDPDYFFPKGVMNMCYKRMLHKG
jgi:hypothetical protein